MTETESVHTVKSCALDERSFTFSMFAPGDAARVHPLMGELADKGYAMWFDESEDGNWNDEAAIAVINCAAFVLFMSKHSSESARVREGIEYAINKKKKIIAICLDGTEYLPEQSATAANYVISGEVPEITEKISAALESCGVEKKDAPERKSPDGDNHGGLSGEKKRSVGGIIAVVVLMMAYNLFMNRGAGIKPIKLEKAVYAPTEIILMVIRDTEAAPLGKNGVIGVSEEGAPQGVFVSYKPISADTAATDIRAPEKPGPYEIRFYSDEANLTQSGLSGVGKFDVEN